ARGGELRVAGAVLAAMRGGDEGAIAAGAGEDDVARLVPDQQRAGGAGRRAADVDDTDRVGEAVDDPDLRVGTGGDGEGLEPGGDGVGVGEPGAGDGEDLEAVVGRVGGEEPGAVG